MIKLCVALALIGCTVRAETSKRLRDITTVRFRVGDVWDYRTRPGEGNSTLTILKIEYSSIGVIIHIAVGKLTWRDCENTRFEQTVPHMPFALRAIEGSVVARVASGRKLPEFQEGYRYWLKDNGGVYTISVREAVEVAETTWRSGIGCK